MNSVFQKLYSEYERSIACGESFQKKQVAPLGLDCGARLEAFIKTEETAFKTKSAVIGIGPAAFRAAAARAAASLAALGAVTYGLDQATQILRTPTPQASPVAPTVPLPPVVPGIPDLADWLPKIFPELRQVGDELFAWMLTGAATALGALREISPMIPPISDSNPCISLNLRGPSGSKNPAIFPPISVDDFLKNLDGPEYYLPHVQAESSVLDDGRTVIAVTLPNFSSYIVYQSAEHGVAVPNRDFDRVILQLSDGRVAEFFVKRRGIGVFYSSYQMGRDLVGLLRDLKKEKVGVEGMQILVPTVYASREGTRHNVTQNRVKELRDVLQPVVPDSVLRAAKIREVELAQLGIYFSVEGVTELISSELPVAIVGALPSNVNQVPSSPVLDSRVNLLEHWLLFLANQASFNVAIEASSGDLTVTESGYAVLRAGNWTPGAKIKFLRGRIDSYTRFQIVAVDRVNGDLYIANHYAFRRIREDPQTLAQILDPMKVSSDKLDVVIVLDQSSPRAEADYRKMQAELPGFNENFPTINVEIKLEEGPDVAYCLPTEGS